MKASTLAQVWLSGSLEFRPAWLAQEFVLGVALRDPVKAAEIVAELMSGGRHPSCGTTFAMHMAEYRRSAISWRIHEIERCEKQTAINERRRGPGGVILRSIPGPGAAWSRAA
jgi:hypothetical protein